MRTLEKFCVLVRWEIPERFYPKNTYSAKRHNSGTAGPFSMIFIPATYLSNICRSSAEGEPRWQVAATFFLTEIIRYPPGADLAYRWTSQKGKNELTTFDPVGCLTRCSRTSKWRPRANIRVSRGERGNYPERCPRAQPKRWLTRGWISHFR